ncbi:MAG TPA: PQQ-binding-like beta-propeller repeat protein [Blastocatellia bacterium]|jgi:hypothetical protein
MTASPLAFDFSRHCPHVACGEMISVPQSRVCPHCGGDLIYCSSCRATNRVLAAHCRACGESLASESWPAHAGIKDGEARFSAIRSIDPPRQHVRLGASVTAQMVATDGILIVPLGDGSVSLVSESNLREITRLALAEPVAVSATIRNGMLFVASGKKLLAFDLARHLNLSSRNEIAPAWIFEGNQITQPLLADAERIYLSSRDGHRTVIEAVSQKSGASMWAAPVMMETAQTAPPLLVKNILIIIALSGEAQAVESESGRVLGKFSLSRRLSHVSPYVAGSRALVVDENNSLYEIALSERGLKVNLIYTHPARILSLAASEELIAIGHLSGLTLLNSRGSTVWSNDLMDSISVAPIIASSTIFALDDAGMGLLFEAIRSNPSLRVKMLGGEVLTPPVMTHSSLAAVNAAGELSIAAWR